MRARAPLRARQLFLQALLQIAAVVPSGQEIGDAGAQQARPVDGIFDADGGDRAQMREKIGAVVPREAGGVAAAETQRTGRAVLARQRHQRGALEIRAYPETADDGPRRRRAEPRLVQSGELRRQADQRIDEENLLELVGPVAARDQQMPDLVLRIEQHDADRIERVGLAQAVDHGAQQLRRLSARSSGNSRACVRFKIVSLCGGLGRQFRETLLERLRFPESMSSTSRHAHALNPRVRAARTSK